MRYKSLRILLPAVLLMSCLVVMIHVAWTARSSSSSVLRQQLDQAHSQPREDSALGPSPTHSRFLDWTFTVPRFRRLSRLGPKPHQIVLLTAGDGRGHNEEIKNILLLTGQNRRAYCEQHGYACRFANISKYDLGSVHPVWKKIPAIIDAFKAHTDAEWVFLLDLDAIIMSPHQDLSSLILRPDALSKALDLGAEFKTTKGEGTGHKMINNPNIDNLDLLISQDYNGLNASS